MNRNEDFKDMITRVVSTTSNTKKSVKSTGTKLASVNKTVVVKPIEPFSK